MLEDKIRGVFKTKCDKSPEFIVKAPGRINLIGEHTDYNLGYVLPAAIDYYMYLGFAKNNLNTYHIYSIDFDEQVAVINAELIPDDNSWLNLIKGVIYQLQDQISGFDLVFCGNIPSGAGLSSSAALCCGTAFGLSSLYDLGLSKWDVAKIAQKSEHTFAMVQCGIMDQFASIFGRKNHVLILDCLTLDYEESEIDLSGYELVLLDSNVKHSLNDSEYNARRNESITALDKLSAMDSTISNFRDVDFEFLRSLETEEIWWKRAMHVVTENQRVLAISTALKKHEIENFGKLLLEGHHSEKYFYEITCPETDFLVDALVKHKAILGARQVGGGFGGCILGVGREGAIEQVVEMVNREYMKEFDKKTRRIPIKISDGCHFSLSD